MWACGLTESTPENTNKWMNERRQKPQGSGWAPQETLPNESTWGIWAASPRQGTGGCSRDSGGGSPRRPRSDPLRLEGASRRTRKRGGTGGGTEGSAGGERGGRERDWVKRREAGVEGRTEAPAPLLEKSPQIPRARGDRLDVTASRLGARPPSLASPRHRRPISPPTPAPLPLVFDPAPQSHPGRLGPLRTSHTAHRRQPPSSRARAPAPPPNAAST